MITLLLTGSAGLQSAPLILTGLVIAFITAEVLRDRFVPSAPEAVGAGHGSGAGRPEPRALAGVAPAASSAAHIGLTRSALPQP